MSIITVLLEPVFFSKVKMPNRLHCLGWTLIIKCHWLLLIRVTDTTILGSSQKVSRKKPYKVIVFFLKKRRGEKDIKKRLPPNEICLPVCY